ncbi:phosphoribosylaminoimidazolesuccinocarboxamide synthase [Halothermothrix orenii]|uniref:Phosphoribosylaminoimidazole-succinocarboxamide synthase n=1 Tax=Halothermothrix orenii (strain H 168 / OCM 544 / DSM 9562) TaxID=373903 RepID=B8D0M5_HALOH|nr:phosphoribosylaminoimidazolesuccinocarboxamide synthase [Halothermothrix orenii]ACL70961.1 phosphoribosylaminoimidazole-succinocarboxamide synthase [Halothermothrix orenii H 168]
MLTKLEMLYEGKAKKVYRTEDKDRVIIEYKDDATAFNGKKKGTIQEKGFYNAQISAALFNLLEDNGVKTHFIKKLGDREQLTTYVDIIPLEVVVRNIVAGSLSKRLGLEEGYVLEEPIIEFYYKRDDLGDPLLNNSHIRALKLADEEEIKEITAMGFKVNDILRNYLSNKGIELVDFKLEFGKNNGNILLADEISPDTCRFWDKSSGEKLDKDRFRRDLGGVENAYREVWSRVK